MARDPWASPRVILFAPPFSFHFTIHKRDKYALSKNNKRHSDLAQLMANDAFHYSEGIVLCNGNVEVEGKTVYLPIYRIEFIQNTKNEGRKLVHLDISSLI